MTYFLSKLVGFFADPFLDAVLLAVFGWVLLLCGRRKSAAWMIGAALLWTYVWSLPALSPLLVVPLERAYPEHLVASLPNADLVHILGGGMNMGGKTNEVGEVIGGWLPDCRESADRVWHGARIWKAGKAPKVLITGPECGYSTVPFLVDLGVDTNAVIVAESPRTTEEEAKLVNELVGNRKEELGIRGSGKPKVLVVSTAIHMRRAMMLYRQFAPQVEAIPAPTDYMELPYEGCRELRWQSFVPSSDVMGRNRAVLHEYLGYWGRKVLNHAR